MPMIDFDRLAKGNGVGWSHESIVVAICAEIGQLRLRIRTLEAVAHAPVTIQPPQATPETPCPDCGIIGAPYCPSPIGPRCRSKPPASATEPATEPEDYSDEGYCVGCGEYVENRGKCLVSHEAPTPSTDQKEPSK